ncbi:MAG TPA: DUF72 domain-containing protein [Xanthomonadaceae bacterium]|nr:DUF72 domain-containing protein [Xanthomonadaceae bacterium]
MRTAQSPLFGEGSSHLARYATRFAAVEINSSFYRPHLQKTYARWATTVPPDFRFSVKLPRAITHDARLIGADEAIADFCNEVAGLGVKLGAVLVQLPPSLVFDVGVAERFFGTLRRWTAAPVACEPRHPSWFGPDADRLWPLYLITRVAADPARCPAASHVAGDGPLRYWRWHGSPRIYYSGYEDEALKGLASQLRSHAAAGRTAWCIFDNTALGHAATDALRLQELCGRAAERSPLRQCSDAPDEGRIFASRNR